MTGYNDQLNDGDESRTLSDASLVEKDDDGKPIRKRRANGTQITTIERSKTGGTACWLTPGIHLGALGCAAH